MFIITFYAEYTVCTGSPWKINVNAEYEITIRYDISMTVYKEMYVGIVILYALQQHFSVETLIED